MHVFLRLFFSPRIFGDTPLVKVRKRHVFFELFLHPYLAARVLEPEDSKKTIAVLFDP